MKNNNNLIISIIEFKNIDNNLNNNTKQTLDEKIGNYKGNKNNDNYKKLGVTSIVTNTKVDIDKFKICEEIGNKFNI
jgi:hypothetical protein